MTGKQKILKALYPAWIQFTKLTGKNTMVLKNGKGIVPPETIYELSVQLNNNDTLRLESIKGKKLLLVNTASDCGYTQQYEDLQQLYEKYREELVIIGLPANDFKEQEKGSDTDIAQFCRINYGVTFPLALKSTVVKSESQHEVFKWLTDKSRNGWNEKAPSWNFSKYLVNEQGVLTHYFDPSVLPMGEDMLKAIRE